MLPDLLHIIPIGDDTMLERIIDLHETTKLLGLLADEDIAFQGAGQGANVFWAADVRREVAFGEVLASEARTDCAAAIVQHNRRVEEARAHDGEKGLGKDYA